MNSKQLSRVAPIAALLSAMWLPIPAAPSTPLVSPVARQTSKLEVLNKLQPLSAEIKATPPAEREELARRRSEEMGIRFISPSSPEGRSWINKTIARQVIRIVQSDASDFEKNREVERWVAEAGATLHGDVSDVKAKKKKKQRDSGDMQIMLDCQGFCGDFTILGSGCILTCQQYLCPDPNGFFLFYSETWYICGTEYTVFPPNYTEPCPCVQ